MRYVQGKGSRKAHIHACESHRNNEQFPDYFGQCRTRDLAPPVSIIMFVALHLSNQPPRGLTSLSKRGKERKERNKTSCCSSFVLLTFAFEAYPIDIASPSRRKRDHLITWIFLAIRPANFPSLLSLARSRQKEIGTKKVSKGVRSKKMSIAKF